MVFLDILITIIITHITHFLSELKRRFRPIHLWKQQETWNCRDNNLPTCLQSENKMYMVDHDWSFFQEHVLLFYSQRLAQIFCASRNRSPKGAAVVDRCPWNHFALSLHPCTRWTQWQLLVFCIHLKAWFSWPVAEARWKSQGRNIRPCCWAFTWRVFYASKILCNYI